MPYLGNIPAENYASFDKQTITGDGGTSYTLTHPVGSAQEVAIFVNNVRQEPGVAYTVAGTALTMTGNVESTDDFYAIFIGKAVQSTVFPATETIVAAGASLSGAATITTADNTSQLTLISTDADASVGPRFDLKRDSGSPADGDTLGRVRYMFDNDAAEQTEGVRLDAVIVDASDGTEDTKYQISTMVGGTLRNRIDVKEDSVVINQDSQDLDFRVESNAKTAAFFVEGGGGTDGFIGLNTSSPQKMLHLVKNDSDGIIILDADNTVTDHQICFAKNYGTGGQSGGKYFGLGVDGSESRFVIAYDENAQASLSADAMWDITNTGQVRSYTTEGGGAFRFRTSIAAGTGFNLIDGYHSASSVSTGTQCFFMTTNGNMYNTNNSYNGISDSKLKENIVDANSQWDDVKALQVRRYNMIGDTEAQLGVIAQELETAGMNGLVTTRNDTDADGNDLGTTTKSVKYSVLYMKAVKALQEAMTKIETLETEMTALKARVTTLENA